MSEPVPVSINPSYAHTIDLSRIGLKNPVKFIVNDPYLYIVDHSEAVYKCDAEGDVVSHVSRAGQDRLYPVALVKDFQYLYVLDRLRGIVKFTLENDFNQFYWISPNIQNDELYEPQAIAMDTNKDIYIADAGQNAIVKINSLGLREWQYGRFGTNAESIQDPVAIAVNNRGHIFVVDQQRSRVSIYSQDQTLIDTISDLNEPTDIALLPGPIDTVFVCDKGNNTIEFFQNNKHLGSISIPGTPQAIAIKGDLLYVLDAQTKRMYVYAL